VAGFAKVFFLKEQRNGYCRHKGRTMSNQTFSPRGRITRREMLALGAGIGVAALRITPLRRRR
jgi:hypothetical protein